MAKQPTKILVLGGGFGGVRTALKLAGSKDVTVQLVSDLPNFRYYPALYRYAVGRSHLEAFVPLHALFRHHPNITITTDRVTDVDPERHKVKGSRGEYDYDRLVVALGSVTNFFGIPGLKQFSYGMKSIDEAMRLRRHLHAELLDDSKPDLNYVVVGGGPTGVELSAALVHYLQRIIRLHGLQNQRYSVDLVEASDRLLPRMPADVSAAVAKRLKKLGVRLYLGTAVEAETADSIRFKGEVLRSQTVIWTAGVANNPFFKANPVFKFDKHGKVEVDRHLCATPDIYVIGDNASTPYSGLAQTALYDADFVADDIRRRARRRRRRAYVPKRPIYVIPVGLGWAAVLWGKVRIYGVIGWLLRRAADLLAYNDIEPLGQAMRSWFADVKYEEDCPICSGKEEFLPTAAGHDNP